jgi:hypothetical protein
MAIENTKTMLGSPEFLSRLLELSYRFCTTEDFSEMDWMTCIACTDWIWHIIAEVSATCGSLGISGVSTLMPRSTSVRRLHR